MDVNGLSEEEVNNEFPKLFQEGGKYGHSPFLQDMVVCHQEVNRKFL